MCVFSDIVLFFDFYKNISDEMAGYIRTVNRVELFVFFEIIYQ